MYSKKVLNFYIAERIHQLGYNQRQLAAMLNVTQSNLSRALDNEAHNLTLPQFAMLIRILKLDSSQVYHILTGKREKEATASLVASSAKNIVEKILVGSENGKKRPV